MSDRKDEKLNNGDLREIKSLIGDADSGGFSLDDILAEFGGNPSARPGGIPVRPSRDKRDNVVAFPGGTKRPEPEEELEEPDGPDDTPEDEPETDNQPEEDADEASEDTHEDENEPEDEPGESDQDDSEDEESDEEEPDQNVGDDRIVEFPQPESILSAFFKGLGRKADDYADQMYAEDENTDLNEVRRLEKLIPGTDREEHRDFDLRRLRKPRPPEPPPPDTDPHDLAKTYSRGLKALRLRALVVALLFLAALAQLIVPAVGLVWLPPLDSMAIQCWGAAGLMALGLLLGLDVLVVGLSRAFHGKVGMDSLAALACLTTLGDGVVLALTGDGAARLPYTAVALAGLWCQLHGSYHKKCALRLSCRTAAASSHPYRVTLDEGKWNGRDTYAKWSGDCRDFGSRVQMDDGAQLIFRRYCPLLLLGDILLSVLATVGRGRSLELLWGMSALFCATAAFGGALAYGRSFHKIARRLIQSGGALAGWPGAACARRGDRVLITDGDLFPPGYVELNGYKVLGDFPMERVVAYTATLIRDSGSGLTKLFHDHLRALGGLMRNADHLHCYEGGGLSANIRGDQVLVGSAAFMNLMEVSLPVGLNVKNAVFCAIDGELAGIFALSYTLPDTVFPSIEELMREKVGPVLATRDFNLIPAMLKQRFKLAADKMDFPSVERRRELSDPDQSHSDQLVALLCREGIYPLAESVTGARRLRWATVVGAVLCCVGSTLGLLLAAYLVSAQAYGSLSPLNLLIFLLTWLAPVWFLSGWVHRY